jgi:hypothetical protein
MVDKQRRQSRVQYVISEADERLLRVLLRYHCLTAMQATKLFYKPSSLHWVQAKLKALTDAGYLVRDRVPYRLSEGSTPLYYALARAGLNHLAAHGVPVPPRARPYRVHAFSYLHISHLLAVNEVLIAAELLCRAYPQFRLARPPLHDKDLGRTPVSVIDRDGVRRTVVPDGFLDFELHHTRERMPLCLELDRGTEHQADWRTKIRALLAFADGPYQQAFGRQSLTICVVTTDAARLASLRRWTAAELDAQHAGDDDRELFRLASFAIDWNVPEDERPTPAELFLAPRWYAPFAAAPAPLFDL